MSRKIIADLGATPDLTWEDLGRVAYGAFCDRVRLECYDPIPDWPSVTPEGREAWTDAARAVVGRLNAQGVPEAMAETNPGYKYEAML